MKINYFKKEEKEVTITKGLTLLAIIAALVITGRATHAAD